MELNHKKRILALLIAMAMFIITTPVFAEDAVKPTVELIIEEITLADTPQVPEALPFLKGEAKFKVSAKGADISACMANLSFNVSGNMKFKSIKSLVENETETNSVIGVPKDGTLAISIVYTDSIIDISSNNATDICILTFSGETGASVTLSLDDGDNSYFALDFPEAEETLSVTMQDDVTANAAENGSESVSAKIKIMMDKVTSFDKNADNYGIELSITGEDRNNPVSFKKAVTESTRDLVPTLFIETSLPANMTYTVELLGAGYTQYKKTGVSFNNELTITNASFIPGDIIVDGKVDLADKTKFLEIKESGVYNFVADFNRDKKIDAEDERIFNNINDSTGDNDTEGDDSTGGGTTGGGTTGGGSIGGGSIGGGSIGGGSIGGGSIGGGSIGGGSIGGGSIGGGSIGGGSIGGGSIGGGSIGGTPTETTPTKVFTDLGNHTWAEEYIYKLKNLGIINGTTATTYSPANKIIRGDFTLILARMLKLPEAENAGFADVPEDSYYAKAIASAKAAGIAQGDGVNFRPTENITRQDLMVLAYRAFLSKGYIAECSDTTVLDAFSDKENISDYALAPMAALVKAGVINGSDGKLNPLSNATRAEVAAMCARLYDLIK